MQGSMIGLHGLQNTNESGYNNMDQFNDNDDNVEMENDDSMEI